MPDLHFPIDVSGWSFPNILPSQELIAQSCSKFSSAKHYDYWAHNARFDGISQNKCNFQHDVFACDD